MKLGVYVHRKSVIHSLDVRTKTFVFLIFYPLVAFTSDWITATLLFVSTFLIALIAKVGLRNFVNQIKWFVAFVAVSLFLLCFFLSSGTIEQKILIAFDYTIKISTFINAGVLFAMVTNPNDIPQALMKMRIPHKYGIVLMLGLRLYPILLERIRNIVDAGRCRGIEIGARPDKFVKSISMLLIPILISTLETGSALGDTLIARGYDPNRPITVSPMVKMGKLDYTVVSIATVLIIIVVLT